MDQGIIILKNLKPGCHEEDISVVFSQYTITRVAIQKNIGYVQFNDSNDIQTLQFRFPGLRIPDLGNVEIDIPQNSYWPQPYQEKKEQVNKAENFQKHQPFLAEAIKQTFIYVINCDKNILSAIQRDEIRNKIFGNYKTGQIFFKGDGVVVEFKDPLQLQKLEGDFPRYRINSLGSEAQISMDDPHFTLQQLERQESQKEKSHKEKQYQNSLESQEKVLHENILPKLEKMTSMEQNFIINNNQEQKAQKKQIQHIHEDSKEHIHTKQNLIPEENNQNNQGFSNIETKIVNKKVMQNEGKRQHILQGQAERKNSTRLVVLVSLLVWLIYLMS